MTLISIPSVVCNSSFSLGGVNEVQAPQNYQWCSVYFVVTSGWEEQGLSTGKRSLFSMTILLIHFPFSTKPWTTTLCLAACCGLDSDSSHGIQAARIKTQAVPHEKWGLDDFGMILRVCSWVWLVLYQKWKCISNGLSSKICTLQHLWKHLLSIS